MFKRFFKNKKAFSLIELIVTIAIMAILTVIFTPSIIQYVEIGRANKDNTRMQEVVDAVSLAMQTNDLYEEMLSYKTYDNYSCYVDSTSATSIQGGDVNTNMINFGTANKYFMYSDNARQKAGEAFTATGCMAGVTITFTPTENHQMIIKQGLINNMFDDGVTTALNIDPDTHTVIGTTCRKGNSFTLKNSSFIYTCYLSDMVADSGKSYFYNRIWSILGQNINLTSATYKNSSYTIFIKFGSSGGLDSDKEDKLMIYGQWGGVELAN